MNIYQPTLMRIESVCDETPDTRTLRLVFKDPAMAERFSFKAGQFGEYSVLGHGESTLCIASSPTRTGYIECTFKKVGKLTSALHQLGPDDLIGFRGPYGNHFPLDKMHGANLLFIAGGIGLAPVRCVIWNVLDQRDRFGNISILYGARSVSDLVYKKELAQWAGMPHLRLWQTVDPGGETADWTGLVGFVPTVLQQVAPSSDDTFAVICGPPIMIRFTLPVLQSLGFPPERIYTTLENRMKCGLGKCGRCNIGSVYVCKDGPVFNAAQLQDLPPDM